MGQLRIYPHKANARGDCVKCGDTVRFNHFGPSTCPIPDDEDELRCADVAEELKDIRMAIE